MNFFKWFLYFIALGAFIWFVFFKPLNGQSAQTNDKLSAENTEQTEDIYQPERTIDEESTPNTSDNEAAEVSEVSSEGSINLNNKYLVIVGSFSNPANANKMLQRVKNSGKDGIITPINGLHRVVTGSSDNHVDAKELRAHFTHIYKEPAFILTQ